MKDPKDYIVFPLDLPSRVEAIQYIDMLKDHIGVFKVGLELFTRTGPSIINYIKSHSNTKVFLDLKLHDIPTTVGRAMDVISDLGVDFTTVHCGENPKMLESAARYAGRNIKVLGVTVLTSIKGNHIKNAGYDEKYYLDMTKLVDKRASMAHRSGLSGIVCSGFEVGRIKFKFGASFIAMTPGIRPSLSVKNDQKRVVTPADAIKSGSDYLVIGRPIRDADDPVRVVCDIIKEIKSVK